MVLFTSSREKRFWLYAMSVLVAILATLFLGQPIQDLLRDQNVQAVFFVLGMLLTGIAIIFHGLKVRAGRAELTIWIGLAAVYLMFIFRLGAPERSHLIEYSILAIFIHKALLERMCRNHNMLKPAVLAFLITVLVGAFDEGLQFFLPERIFDREDIVFNSMAAFMAISSSIVLHWAQKKLRKR